MSKKKFDFVRAGAITTVLALGTSCFMGGTLAKYVTSADGSDSARVAKFGVEVTAVGSVFAKEYAADDTSFTLAANSVVSSGDDNVVAPGTKGNMTAITLSGTPEVAVEVAYAVDTFDLGEKWIDADGNYYCPLIFTIGSAELNGLDYDSADAFENAVISEIEDFTAQYEANTDLSTAAVSVPAVSWEWPFESGDAADPTANDVKDTYLGDQAAAGNAATVELTMTVTVTQID